MDSIDIEGSGYCPLCESCGYEGCCNFIKCYSKLIESSICDNGRQYLLDARFHFRVSQLSEEVIDKLEKGTYNKDQAVKAYRDEHDQIYKNIYTDNDIIRY